jgi:proteic killer suppression protein
MCSKSVCNSRQSRERESYPSVRKGGKAPSAAYSQNSCKTSLPLITLDIINVIRYHLRVIKSFADAETERIWRTAKTRGSPPPSVTKRKLAMLDAAARLEDMRVPPGNRLEKLKGDRQGQHSIRINDQYRICFTWDDGNECEVEIVDYH